MMKFFGSGESYYWLIIIGIILYVIASINGNNYTADGYAYWEMANNISSGLGYVWGKGEVWAWVPLYPYILSLGFLLGNIDLYIWSLHLVFLVFTYVVWVKYAVEVISDNKYKLLAVLFVILNTSVLYCYVFVLSEAIFITSSGLYLYFITRWLQNERSFDLMAATLSGFATLMLRNAGIFLLSGAFVYAMIYLYKKKDKKNLYIFLLQLMVVLSGFTIWNIQKLVLSGHLDIVTGMVPFLDIYRNGQLLSKSIASIFIPFALPPIVHSGFTVVLFVFIGFVFMKYKTRISIQMLMSVILFYLLFWLIVPADQWEMERFLAPVFPPLLLLIFYLSEKVKIFATYPTWILMLLLIYPAIRIVKNALFWGGFLGDFKIEDFLAYI